MLDFIQYSGHFTSWFIFLWIDELLDEVRCFLNITLTLILKSSQRFFMALEVICSMLQSSVCTLELLFKSFIFLLTTNETLLIDSKFNLSVNFGFQLDYLSLEIFLIYLSQSCLTHSFQQGEISLLTECRNNLLLNCFHFSLKFRCQVLHLVFHSCSESRLEFIFVPRKLSSNCL